MRIEKLEKLKKKSVFENFRDISKCSRVTGILYGSELKSKEMSLYLEFAIPFKLYVDFGSSD